MKNKECDLSEITRIVYVVLKERATEEERDIFERWLHNSEKNKILFDKFNDTSFLLQKYKIYQEIDLKYNRKQFNKKLKYKKRRRVLVDVIRYASIVLIPLCVFWFLKRDSSEDLNLEFGKEEVSLFPVLVLENGKEISLVDSSNEMLQRKKGMEILVQENAVVYTDSFVQSSDTSVYHCIRVPSGCNYVVSLADGSKVWINSGSELKYPVTFLNKERIVYLSGEAYFKVSKNDIPFVVKTQDVDLRVLGTEFNHRAYPDEKKVVTTLINGSVQLKATEEVKLHPGEQSVWCDEKRQFVVREVNTYLYTAWKDGRFVFENTRLEEIFSTLSRWYDLEVIYINSKAKDLKFTGDMTKDEDFRTIVDVIGENERLLINIDGNRILVGLK